MRKWADVMVIAPLSANTLAKIANGLCDNLLVCGLQVVLIYADQCGEGVGFKKTNFGGTGDEHAHLGTPTNC